MKIRRVIKTVLVIAAIMTFAMTSCGGGDEDDSDGNGGGAVTGISNLVLSGQVYGNDDSQFKGNLNISGVYSLNNDVVNIGTGRITNGVLNYTIRTPSNNLLTSYKDFEGIYLFSPNETASNGNVKFLAFSELKPDSEEFDYLVKQNIDSESQTFYIYVDGNVTISSERTTTEYDTINAFSLSLKKGWNIGNYIYRSGLISITLDNTSGAKWILGGGDISDFSDPEMEYTDWEYVTNADGTGRLTLALDGSKPFARKQQRALNPELTMSYDFFEAVFVSGTGQVARASWETGWDASITDVTRGINYGAVYPTTAGASVVFIGKKSGKTLLAIGHLIEVREGNTPLLDAGSPARNSTVITSGATSVTFAVYPLTTRVGFTGSDAVYGTDATATFRTATGDTVGYTNVSAGNTKGSTVNLSRAGSANYPVYTLPDITGATLPRSVSAIYRIGGLAGATSTAPSVNKPDLATSARVIVDGPTERVIKRPPYFILNGAAYELMNAVFDQGTTVTTNSNQTHLAAFVSDMTMTFTQNANSAGIFAITFQVPVCALTTTASTNGGPGFEKWYIRPAHGQYQYLLDDGTGMGGMVMLRTGAVGSDWPDIFTVDQGFNH